MKSQFWAAGRWLQAEPIGHGKAAENKQWWCLMMMFDVVEMKMMMMMMKHQYWIIWWCLMINMCIYCIENVAEENYVNVYKYSLGWIHCCFVCVCDLIRIVLIFSRHSLTCPKIKDVNVANAIISHSTKWPVGGHVKSSQIGACPTINPNWDVSLVVLPHY